MPNKNKTIYDKVQKWITSRIPLGYAPYPLTTTYYTLFYTLSLSAGYDDYTFFT